MSRLAMVGLLTLVAFGCTRDAGPVEAADLEGITFTFYSLEVGGEPTPLVPETSISIRFENGTIRSGQGCNSLSGDFDVDDEGRLIVGPLSSTDMWCSDQRLQEQDWFVQRLLESEPELFLGGTEFRIENENVHLVLER